VPAQAEAIRDLREKAGYLLRRAFQRGQALFTEETRELDITSPQYIILVALALRPGVDQNSLAETVDLDRWTTGDVLARLERRGLLAREVDRSDRRCRKLVLTAAGEQLVQELEPTTVRVNDKLLAPLNAEEQHEFLRLLRKLVGVRDA
jgi:DNA-binding MarR family transcriptional regulator